MSFKNDYILSLAGLSLSNHSESEQRAVFAEVLGKGVHGLCFSPYIEDQKPGSFITEEQIRRRLEIVRPYTKWIRTFSCSEGNEMIPRIAKEYGLKTIVGAWIGDNVVYNEEEIARLLQLARDGYADMVAVGNEVLYRDDLTEDELINYIVRVKKELPGMKVGYVDAYYEFFNRPALTEACDVIFANCFPLWEGCPIDYSLLYVKDMYHRAVKAAKGKKVIISETGWPNRGSSIGDAEPSLANAIRYFVNIQNWAQEDDVDVFYFSAFDELWKMYDEGDLGAYWGLWDMNGRLKYSK